MERHPALQDLSRDHHHGLVWAKRLVEAGEDEAANASPVAREFLDFWDGELADHLTEEEHVLLPVYQRRVDLGEDELVVELVADHAWFRDAVPKLRGRLESEEPLAEHLADLGRRLHDHARMEDRRLFPRLEETLDEAELEEIHRRSKRFRRAHRGEAAIGPRSTSEG